MPMPPIQWFIARQNSRLLGKISKSLIEVEPVVIDDTSAGVAGEVSAVSGEAYFSDDYATASLEAFPE